MRTELNEVGRVIVIDEFSDNEPQPYTVCVKSAEDWEEVHDYIINENEIDGIPNRKIECVSDMCCSSKRSVYQISNEEADVLRKHPKIDWVERSTLYNPIPLEQRKFDEEFDRHILSNRFKKDIINVRSFIGSPGTALTFTQWGLSRHSNTSNNFGSSATLSEDINYSLTGKNVDIVIMDTGVRWDHPEFLKPEYTSVPVGVATETVSRVRDILIHGTEEYGINWSSEGLVAPGTGSLSNYTKQTTLNDSSFNGSWHGSHVAGIAAGNQFGAAFEANIWSIACVDRSDLGWSTPSDGFDYIRVWHKNKPINPETGRRNPTIVNGSWGHRQFVSYAAEYNVTFRGNSYNSTDVEASDNFLPAVWYIESLSAANLYQFTSKRQSQQATTDELFDDSDCNDIICVFSAGNCGYTNGKQDISDGDDYDNQFTSGNFWYGDADTYYNRLGTPAIAHQGQSDAPIVVGSLDNAVVTSGITSERKASYSNNGPAIDVWAAGSTILSAYGSGYADPRNSNYLNNYSGGTSQAAPNVCGVIALYLQSNPSATRVDVRNWLYTRGSVVLDSGNGNPILDPYGDTDPVGAGTSVNYWSYSYGLRGATARILYNPFANNTQPSISGVNISGISFTQS
jgi:hypothetical protein